MYRVTPHPFVKWAGGKQRVAGHIIGRIPKSIDTYYEPFLGGGAIFFELVRQKRFEKAVVSDHNVELINTYNVIKDDVHGLISCLNNGSFIYDKQVYLSLRKVDVKSLSEVERAATFIYLNKTCFNGLYRVNKKGEFNVPFGRYTNPVIVDEKNLIAVSEVLKNTSIIHSDFRHFGEVVYKNDDFIYFDPPYIPISDTSKFSSYTKDGFTMNDHKQLSEMFNKLADSGVKMMMSNSYSDETESLYSKFDKVEISCSRSIGGPASYRSTVKEVIITANIEENHGTNSSWNEVEEKVS